MSKRSAPNGFDPIIILVGIVILAGIILAAPWPYYQEKKEVLCGSVNGYSPKCSIDAGWKLGSPLWNKILPSFVKQNPIPIREGQSDFQSVTIKELIENRDKFNSKGISIKGKFRNMQNVPIPQCIPTGDGKNPQIKDVYRTYPSTWAIIDEKYTLGMFVIDRDGVATSTLPNYKEGQELDLKGMVRIATVPDSCNRDISYKSIYLEVRADDIDIISKSLPKNPPAFN